MASDVETEMENFIMSLGGWPATNGSLGNSRQIQFEHLKYLAGVARQRHPGELCRAAPSLGQAHSTNKLKNSNGCPTSALCAKRSALSSPPTVKKVLAT